MIAKKKPATTQSAFTTSQVAQCIAEELKGSIQELKGRISVKRLASVIQMALTKVALPVDAVSRLTASIQRKAKCEAENAVYKQMVEAQRVKHEADQLRWTFESKEKQLDKRIAADQKLAEAVRTLLEEAASAGGPRTGGSLFCGPNQRAY